MEEQLKIRLTIAGQNELNELIKKINDGTASLQDLRTVQRGLRSEREKNIIGSQSEIRLAEEEVKVKERISQVTEKLMTRKARERDEYFKTGLQLRQGLLPLMGDLTNSLQGGDFSAKNFSSSISNIAISFGRVSAKGVPLQTIFKGMLSSLAGPTGIVLGIGVVTSLALAFTDKFNPAVEKGWKELQKLNDEIRELNLELGKITKEENMEQLLKNLGRLTTERNKLLSEDIIKFDLFAPGFFTIDVDALKQRTQAEKDVLEAEKKIADQRKKEEEEEKKRAEEAKEAEEKKLKQLEKEKEELYAIWDAQYKLGLLNESDRRFQEEQAKIRAKIFGPAAKPAVTDIKGVEGIEPGKVGAKLRGEAKLTFGEMIGQSRAFESAFAVGIGNISQDISSKIGGAFAKVFGGAHTMLGKFVGDFATQLVNILLQLGIKLGLAELGVPVFALAQGGMISEPVVGRGMKSGSIYTIAETQPEYVSPVNRMGQAARFGGGPSGGGSIFVVQNKITATGLRTFVKRGERLQLRTSY